MHGIAIESWMIYEGPSDAMPREYQDDIKKLKAQLDSMNTTTEEICDSDNGNRKMKKQADKEKAKIVERSKVEIEKMKTE